MNRSDLYNLAIKCGIKENKEKALMLMRERLIEYFNSSEGKEILAKAPKIIVEGGNGFVYQNRPVENIVNLILQEVEGFEFS